MKKVVSMVLVFLLMFSFASASSIFPDEKNLEISFNSCTSITGAEQIDADKAQKADGIIMFPCNGYDVLFFLNADNKIEKGGVRLIKESAADGFILASMTLLTMLGKMDYYAYGMMLYQYGQVKNGETNITPWLLDSDYYSMMPGTGNYKIMFVFLNNDLKEWVE